MGLSSRVFIGVLLIGLTGNSVEADAPDPVIPLLHSTPAPGGPPGTNWASTAFPLANAAQRTRLLLNATKTRIRRVRLQAAGNSVVNFGFTYKPAEAPTLTATGVDDTIKRAASVFTQIRALPAPAPLALRHDGEGFYVNVATLFGIKADHTIYPDLSIPSDEYIFAPTMLGAGTDCIEVVTAYNSLAPQIWAWDWCAPDKQAAPAQFRPVDVSFLKSYVRDLGDGLPKYTTETVVTPDGKTWRAYIHNYSTTRWDPLYSTSGHRFRADFGTIGWSFFETFASPTAMENGQADFCARLTNPIAASNIATSSDPSLQPSTFQQLLPSDSSPLAINNKILACPLLQFTTISKNYQWQVNSGRP